MAFRNKAVKIISINKGEILWVENTLNQLGAILKTCWKNIIVPQKKNYKKNSELGAKGLLTRIPFENKTTRTPTTIRRYFPDNRKGLGTSLHPTQKPLELMEWIVGSYTNEGDTILDFTCGSGTTLVASKKLNRKCYGIELEEKYCEVTKNRLLEVTQ